jgi:hypothetical protein
MKKLLGILVAGLLLSGNAYAGWFDKLPVLACKIGDDHITYDLRKYTPATKANTNTEMIIFDPEDDRYRFIEYINQDDGTERAYRYTVNRYTGIINLLVSPKYVDGQIGATANSLKTEYTFNGTCKGAK